MSLLAKMFSSGISFAECQLLIRSSSVRICVFPHVMPVSASDTLVWSQDAAVALVLAAREVRQEVPQEIPLYKPVYEMDSVS